VSYIWPVWLSGAGAGAGAEGAYTFCTIGKTSAYTKREKKVLYILFN
jgi:hypothetical protein